MKEQNIFVILLRDIIIAFVLAMIILFFIQPTVVRQSSMENNFHDGDYLIISKRAYSMHSPERGDVITFRSELESFEDTGLLGWNSGKKLLIKRIIGLPGDTIRISDGCVYINEEKYPEDYIKGNYTPAGNLPVEGETAIVPDNCYYVMGDNREVSIDSRDSSVGFVSKDDIMGKVALRIYPFSKFGRINK